MPPSHAIAAAMAAPHQDAPAANASTGNGANHNSGHHGCNPVPNQVTMAVSATASAAATARRRSSADAMQMPPDAAPDQGAELTRAAADAPAEVEHHEPLDHRAHLERDLPGIIGPQLPARHARLQHGDTRVERRRPPRL